MITQSEYLRQFFNNLNDAHIRYAVLRNYQKLPDSCGGSDMDIWVNETDRDNFFRIAENVSGSCGGHLVSYLTDRTCPRLIYLGNNWGIQVDVHIGVAQHRGVPYMDNSIIEQNIIEHNGIYVLNPKIDCIISFLKEVLNNKKCRPDYCEKIREALENETEGIIEDMLRAFSLPIRKMMASTILEGKFDKLAIRQLGKTASEDLQTFPSRLRYYSGQIKKVSRLSRPLGYTVAVLGTDGSGKSFIINSITPILNEAFHNGIRYEHLRPNYLPSLAVLTGKKKKTDKVEVCSNPHGSKPSGFLGSLARLSYYWLDYTWGYFRKVFFDKTFKTHVWLFDRYYYDYYIDQRRARLSLPGWILKFYGLFVPAPDLTICLGGDPHKIYARKPETSLQEVTRQTAVLQEFAHKHKKTVWVDTTVEPEESIESTMSVILEMMSKRYSKTTLK